MDNGQKQWDKLIHLPEEYERNPAIAQSVIEELQRESAPVPKKNWWGRKWKALAACAAAVLVAVCVGIPVYHKLSTPQIVYFEQNEIAYEDIDDPVAFVEGKDLDILYFDNAAMLTTKSASIIENGQFAFLEQNTLHINSEGFCDKVSLWSVSKKYAEFNFYVNYESLVNSHRVGDISVAYKIEENLDEFNQEVFAKFTYQKKDYFLDIVTELDGVQQLEVYVNILLEK